MPAPLMLWRGNNFHSPGQIVPAPGLLKIHFQASCAHMLWGSVMRITRIVALAIIAGTIGMQGGSQGAEAQTLRASSPPAEVPPASYKGKQYVDSRGCIYIRAGIDGNVNWVPRVTRSRKQLCGYKPTTVEGAARTASQSSPAFEMITLPEAQRPDAAGDVTPAKRTTTQPAVTASRPSAAPAAPAAAPTVVTTAKPRRTANTTSANPARVSTAAPRKVVKPVPVAPTPAPVPEQTAPAASGCAGVSDLSRQYINTGPGVRCGPQAESPITYGRGDRNSSLILAPNTRVVPTHVYQARRASSDISVPEGYRPVWGDDRLNPHRAERTVAPSVIRHSSTVPPGYIRVEREDDRMNTMRARGTPEGDARMAEIWTNTVPRTLIRKPVDRQTVRLGGAEAVSAAEAREPLLLRLSTRSDPKAESAGNGAPRRYVRAATFEDAEAARVAAQALAQRTGLPVRLGTVTRKGQSYKVVLAGPFSGDDSGKAALTAVKAAGYPKARLSK